MTAVAEPTPRTAWLPTHAALATPTPARVLDRRVEGDDVVTIFVHPVEGPLPPFAPAQFSMVGVAGIGEAPISISTPVSEQRVHGYTIRRAGAVTRALVELERGDIVTLRGPFGRPWDLETTTGRDMVFVAGGIGIAPLRAAIEFTTEHRARFGDITVLVGALDPSRLVYADWLDDLRHRDVRVGLTVDAVADGQTWPHATGFVTTLIDEAVHRPETELIVCGPDPMMRAAIAAAGAAGVGPDHVQVTLERNMHCGVGWCGHCQLGGVFVCRDGPVMTAAELGDRLEVPEL